MRKDPAASANDRKMSSQWKKKKKEDQIGAGSCHGFSVVTIIISYRDFNTTVDCFCSCRGVSDALADFNPLRFSFLFDDDKKRKQKKTNTLSTWRVTYVFDLVFCQNRRSREPAADRRLAVFSCSAQLAACDGCFHSANLKPSHIPLAPA